VLVIGIFASPDSTNVWRSVSRWVGGSVCSRLASVKSSSVRISAVHHLVGKGEDPEGYGGTGGCVGAGARQDVTKPREHFRPGVTALNKQRMTLSPVHWCSHSSKEKLESHHGAQGARPCAKALPAAGFRGCVPSTARHSTLDLLAAAPRTTLARRTMAQHDSSARGKNYVWWLHTWSNHW